MFLFSNPFVWGGKGDGIWGLKIREKKMLPKTPRVAPPRFTVQLASFLGWAPTASGDASGSCGTWWAAPGCGVLRDLGAETQARGRFRFWDPFSSRGFPASQAPTFQGMAVRTPPTGWVRIVDLGQARGTTSLTRLPAVGAPEQNCQHCPRERFPKPNLVWPSGAAVQSTLLKGERWLRHRDVGSPRGPGARVAEPRCAGRTGGAAN